MTPERWEQIHNVLEKALELAPGERSAFLNQACASDQSLRQEVETLLASSDDVLSSFLQSSAPRVTLSSGTKLGEYEVKSLLGSGGMGEVYRARDSRLGRDVAIKVLPSFVSSDPNRLRRFEQEARAAAALNHPNILAVYQMGTYEGAPYLVSELLEGETLREPIRRGRLSVRRAIDYGVQIARGLAAAHEKGIVHRDLKPENLFVTKDGRVKILDFGLAKLTQPQSSSEHSALTQTEGTEAGVVMGTMGYMSPEQVRGQTVDHRADIFAFGAILYEMLAGNRAFQKPTSPETMTAILNEDPPGISQVTTNISPGLQRVVHRCLEKNPEQRFQSASDLAFALDALSEGSSAGAKLPAKLGDEAGLSFIRGHGLWRVKLFYGLFIAFTLLVLGFGWFWFKGKHAVPERVLSEEQITRSLVENHVLGGSISPDGKYVAYADSKGLHLITIQSGESHDIALPEDLRTHLEEVNWFPDGERLIIKVNSESEGGVLWSISVFGGAPRKLRIHSAYAKVSPDGLMIAFVSGFVSGRGHEIWLMGAGGENARKIQDTESYEYGSLAWSPSSHRLAYVKRFEKAGLSENFGGSIETLSLDGGLPTVVVADPGLFVVGGMVWLPDGRLVFSSSAQLGGRMNLWAILTDSQTGVASGKPTQMTNWADSTTFSPSVSSDGSRLVAVKDHSWNDVFVGELKDNGTRLDSPKRLTSSDSLNAAVGWTRDSGTVLLMSNSMGRFQIFKQRIDADAPELLVSSPDDQMWPAFSPDAAWILYWSAAHGTRSQVTSQRLMRFPASGGSPEQVLEAPVDPMVAFGCPSRPSSSCVISRGERGQLIFYALDPVQGQGKEIIRTKLEQANDLEWHISPDGSHIAIASWNRLREQIRILDLQNGTERNLALPKQWEITGLSWAADQKALFAGAASTKFLIARIDLDGNTHVLLDRMGVWLGGPYSSPDARHLAYFQQTSDDNLWLLKNF
jgi:serine/threonine protein kinase/Tol biopolymer transport system component